MALLEKSRVQKILIIKLRAIGDVVLSTATLKNLRTAYPHARIDFLTEYYCKDVVEGNPDIDSIIAFNNKEESGLSLVRRIRSGRYDLVIDLFGNPRSAIVTLFSGAFYRVGYRFGWRKYCYSIVVEPRGGEKHNIDFNLDALKEIDIPVIDRTPVFPLSDDAKRFAQDFFKNKNLLGKLVVVLNPGGGWYTKRWKLHSYAGLAKKFRKEFDAKILICWGPGEQAIAEEIRLALDGEADLTPRTSLKELAAILERCSLMITNDSGPMHIAAAMGTPIVALYGPTRPELQGPESKKAVVVQKKDLTCLGCNLTDCPIGNPCMEELSVETVYSAAKNLIEQLQIIHA
ncbi:MAG: lipopolysaccharide heptosyltransferase II [Bacteroidota bacterium]